MLTKPIHCHHATCPRYTFCIYKTNESIWAQCSSTKFQSQGQHWPWRSLAVPNLLKAHGLLFTKPWNWRPAPFPSLTCSKRYWQHKKREESTLCKFDPMISFPCNKGSRLGEHLWDGPGRNRLDFSAILVLWNGCAPTSMPFLQWPPWDLIQGSLLRSKGSLILCDFDNLFFQTASIKPFSLVPQSPSNKRPKTDKCFWFHYSTVSILTSTHFYMHTCQFNSIEYLKNELQCYDSPDPGFEALKQSENKKPQTLSKCQICIPTRTGELWGGNLDLAPRTSACTHQVGCECKILRV